MGRINHRHFVLVGAVVGQGVGEHPGSAGHRGPADVLAVTEHAQGLTRPQLPVEGAVQGRGLVVGAAAVGHLVQARGLVIGDTVDHRFL